MGKWSSCQFALASVMCGSSPEPDAITMSAGTFSSSSAASGCSVSHMSKNARRISSPLSVNLQGLAVSRLAEKLPRMRLGKVAEE